MRLKQSERNEAVCARLFAYPDIKRTAGFGSTGRFDCMADIFP
jgi:hypothetical protein